MSYNTTVLFFSGEHVSDYFESDEIVKSYDSGIFKRIVSYLKPYRRLVLLTAAALIISTIGELMMPIIQQRVIDDAVLARFLTFNLDNSGQLSKEAAQELDRLKAIPQSITIDHYLFVPQRHNVRLSETMEQALKDAGVLERTSWYRFLITDKARTIIAMHSDWFITNERYAALKTADLNQLTHPERTAIRSADISFITRGAVLLLALLITVFAFTFVQTWHSSLIGQYVMKDLRLELFKKTAHQSTAFLSKHPVGRIVTRLTSDVETINEFFTSVLVAFLKDISIMAGSLMTLFFLSPALGFVALLTLPPVLIITIISRTKARDAFRRQRTASSRVNAYLAERLAGVQVVQLFHGEQKSNREFNVRNTELLEANLKEMYVYATFRPSIEFLSTVTTAVIIGVGASMVLHLSLSLGTLIAFVNLIAMFYAPVTDIAEKYTLLQSAMAGGERIFTFLDTDESISDRGTHTLNGNTQGHVAFDHVHFSYRKGEEILKGLTFTVRPGETAAIVGPTGAGKTTIVNLIARLWEVDSGTVKLDGVAVQDIPLNELRRAALPVLQDVFLFSGTVADNIRLGLDLSDAQVEAAARAVYAHDFISALPEGYQTKLSEGATNISSGQRQLISFARVIAHNPVVVILDEATSSIDTETEQLIQLGIQKVLAGRTSIVIAHRLSTIRNADHIFVLSNGYIVEDGTHEKLLAQKGIYANLYRLQFGGT
ncbi:MAG: ATP-binding cassette domain-containing protein [Treponema sp.]|jgi:ATP-binding cassette subfamily B protein|nr:ATP-binding cassette domain-containing protein [Treponema sp.]